MNQGAVRDPRRLRHIAATERRRHELRHVRHPLRPELRVDRVLVCPSGIHVVTTLPETAVLPEGPTRSARPGSAGQTVDAPLVAAAHAAADVVAALLPGRYRDRVRPVLCRDAGEPMADLVEEVLVTTADTLEHIVRSSPVVLSTSEVSEIGLRLEALMEPFPATVTAGPSRWGRRRAALVAVAAAGCAGAVVLVERIGLLVSPW